MNVEFKEDPREFRSRAILSDFKKPKMVQKLIDWNIVDTEKKAGVFLIYLIIGFFLIALIVFFIFTKTEPIQYELSPETIQNLPEEIRNNIL